MAFRWDVARDVVVTVSAFVAVLAMLAGGVTWIASHAVDRSVRDAVDAAVKEYVPVAVAAAVRPLDETIGQLTDRMGKVEGAVGQLSDRMGKVEGAVEQLTDRMGKVEGAVEQLTDRVGKVEGAVGQLSDRMGKVESLALAWPLETVDDLARAYPDAPWIADYGDWRASQDILMPLRTRPETAPSAP